jgi:ribosomal protein S18 acetylase RimI-like enzyme
MTIRPFAESDVNTLVTLTIETFRPFYDVYVRDLLGPDIFEHQHGQWEQDYRDEVPTMHNPAAHQFVAVYDLDEGIAGYVSWKVGPKPQHGEIYMLAVAPEYRSQHVGRELCDHAIAAMKQSDVDVVGIGTGQDDFHAPARALYESLGFTKIPIAGYLKHI